MLARSVFQTKEDIISLNEKRKNIKEYIEVNIDQYKSHLIVVLLGMMGVGKSSISCCLSEKSLVIQAEGRLKYLVGEGVGQGINAWTTIPSINYNANEEISIVDIPGFEDNRSYEQEILNSISIDTLFDVFPDFNKKYKIVLVINSCDFQLNRCAKLIETFSRMKKMFPNYDEIKNTLGVIITKGNKEISVNEYVEYFNDAFNNTENQTADMIDLHLFLNRFQNNIFIFPQPLDADIGCQYDFRDHQSLLTFLKSDYLENPKHNISVSRDAELNLIHSYNTNKDNVLKAINEICRQINNKYLNFFFKYQNETSSIQITNWINRIRLIKNSSIERIKDFEDAIKRSIQDVPINDLNFNNLEELILFDDLIASILKSHEDKTYVKNALITWCDESIHSLSLEYRRALENEQIQHQNELLRQENERRRILEEEFRRKQAEQIEKERRLQQELDLRRKQEEESRRELQKLQSLIARSKVYGG